MVVFIRNQHVKNIELLLDKEQQDASQEIYRLMIDQQSKLEDARIQNETEYLKSYTMVY